MPTRVLQAVLAAVLSSGGSLVAQVVCTATAVQPLVVSAVRNGSPVSQTFPAGPLPPSGVVLDTPGQSSIAARVSAAPWPASYLPPGGGAGWVLSGNVNVAFGFPGGYGAASHSGRVQLRFHSPQPVSGLLYLWAGFLHSPQFQHFNGDATVDIDCNGIPNYRASVLDGSNIQIPMTIDNTGRSICVDLAMVGSWIYSGNNSIQGYATAHWTIVFLEDSYGLGRHATGCSPMEFSRDPFASWRVRISVGAGVAPIAAGFFLLGLGTQNVMLPNVPNCPLLVSSPALVPPDIIGPTGMGLFPPDVHIPPGISFYCQAMWIDTQGWMLTSDSVRTM